MSVEKKTRTILNRAMSETLDTSRFELLKKQIVQRAVLLLVLINENARTSEADAKTNMFVVDESEAEGLVIAKSERELTSLVRALVWLESTSAGMCANCSEPIKNLSLEKAIDDRLCERCVKHGG
ncbi:hypothetical protein A3765_15445 [Oleiphilus sp. HI0130]|jgi:RNA polymerase-binding transcription factor DksA|uniref:hypothetical protein n=1 Tax=unclassified Oleiphilus TaxID=2631174 RepID=UPI0007C3A6CA|nr:MULTISPECIES: hypothetical protein [unclassified Oleiphilus]KZY90205.1 hypothetical protein A3744_21755 [Oleiphilus sp. HI0073]KZZ43862.1 hypothetical protein A3758_04585 [Oleiphilus sp. HI0118]KZZ49158.1 hypothetical protein A3760_02910 [Oleiphilus sp. HI0122]KZZ71047.1 hypothetical protein A3765_15445 [Oleiphilus sp. HI0130]KZZ04836.1 hypothetical protein A3744_09165 [Oleiphilus sp. HI0073]